MMLLMQLIPTNHTVQDGEQNHMGGHAWWKCSLIVPAQQGALPHWTGCQSDATQTFLCVYIKTWTLLWKKILPGSFSVNTPLVSFIVNSEQLPASGIVSTPLPGNNRSGFRVDRIFPSVYSYVTSSSTPSLPSASSTFISGYFFFFIYCYLGWENTLWNQSTHHCAKCSFSVTCFILVLKKTSDTFSLCCLGFRWVQVLVLTPQIFV